MFLFLKIAGVLVLCFNLFTILKIYNANINQKWWKYFLPLLLNFPTFIMSSEAEFEWKVLAFQLLGSDLLIGLQSHFAVVALPIGSLYIWWKLEYWKVTKEFSQIE